MASVKQWELNSWPKICLKLRSEAELRDVQAKAKEHQVNCIVLEKDAKMVGLKTEGKVPLICVVGPALKNRVDLCTGHLKLL